MPLLHCITCHHEWEGRENSACEWCGAGSRVLAAQTELERMVASKFKYPERREGKTPLRVHYRWALAHGREIMHLFWHLSGQDHGKSMCGRATFDADRPTSHGFACTVCERCRERGLPGHPLPRGMA